MSMVAAGRGVLVAPEIGYRDRTIGVNVYVLDCPKGEFELFLIRRRDGVIVQREREIPGVRPSPRQPLHRAQSLGREQKRRCNAQSSVSVVIVVTGAYDIYDSEESSRKPDGATRDAYD
jgi:hypothetical protein